MITLAVTRTLEGDSRSPIIELYSGDDTLAVIPAGLAYQILLARLVPALAIGEGNILGSHVFWNVTAGERDRAKSLSPAEIREIVIREFGNFGGNSAAIMWEEA